MSLVKINEVTANNQANVLLDGITSNEIYYYTFSGVSHVDNNTNGIIRMHDGSSAIDATVYSATIVRLRSDAAPDKIDSTNTGFHNSYASALGNAANQGTQTNGYGYLFDLYDASKYSYLKGNFVNAQFQSRNRVYSGSLGGVVKTTAQYTGIQFVPSTGNINKGVFSLYCLKGS